MPLMRLWLVLAVFTLALLSCHRVVAPPTESTLVGLTLPLIAGPGLRLAVEATVGGRPAEVQFDVVSSIATVTSGCLDEPISGEVLVRLLDPMGEDVTFPVARVEGLVLAHRRYRPFQAA